MLENSHSKYRNVVDSTEEIL